MHGIPWLKVHDLWILIMNICVSAQHWDWEFMAEMFRLDFDESEATAKDVNSRFMKNIRRPYSKLITSLCSTDPLSEPEFAEYRELVWVLLGGLEDKKLLSEEGKRFMEMYPERPQQHLPTGWTQKDVSQSYEPTVPVNERYSDRSCSWTLLLRWLNKTFGADCGTRWGVSSVGRGGRCGVMA